MSDTEQESVAWLYETKHALEDDEWQGIVTLQHPDDQWGHAPFIEYRNVRALYTDTDRGGSGCQ